MTVVFQRTPGKMIPKVTVLTFFLGISSLHTAYGASYSKVYLQSGPGVIPVDYLNYGVPPVATSPQIAQLSAPPGGSVLPLPNIVSPCIAPCILPAQTVARVAPVQPNAKYTNYNTPNQPATMAPTNDDKPSYEYSYVVYDEITGDRKAQRELSDGSVVQGEYSLIQPDGYVREVKYTADDLTGFNAVVQKFLPESVLRRDKKPDVKTATLPPCDDNKKEAIKVERDVDTLNNIQEPIHEEIQKTAHDEKLQESANEPAHDHVHYHDHDHEHDPNHEHFHDHAHNHYHGHDHDHYHGHAHDHFHDHAHEHYHEDELHPEHHHEHVHNETIELTVVPAVEVVPEIITSTAETVLEQVAIEQYEPTTELIKKPVAESLTNKVQNTQATETHELLQTAKPVAALPNGLVSYNDIIKCLQAAIANNSNVLKQNISPLTYVILPGTNKPC